MEKRIRFIEECKLQLAFGMKRDDAYHATVRFAAKNGMDRYALWQDIISEGF